MAVPNALFRCQVAALCLVCLCAPIAFAALPNPQCAPNSPVVQCFADPCAVSTSPCKGNPALTCIGSTCSNLTYLGTKLVDFACKPIYIHKSTLKVVTNCNKPLPATTCAPGSPQAKCAGDPCTITNSACQGDPSYVCVPNSCGKLTYLGTTLTDQICKGIFVDPIKRKVVPACLDVDLPAVKCAKGSRMAKCKGNPCDTTTSPCKGSPDYVCVPSSCDKLTYLGTPMQGQICKGIFVDPIKQKVVPACLDVDLPAVTCAPGSAQAKCKANPCDTTFSPCKGNPNYVCLPSSCEKLTYLGTSLTGQICKAIFVDPLTRKVVPQCLSIPPIECDPGSSYADCLPGNACDKGCKGHPELACVPNFCGKATYLGVKITEKWQCKAVYVNAVTQKVVRSCTPGV